MTEEKGMLENGSNFFYGAYPSKKGYSGQLTGGTNSGSTVNVDVSKAFPESLTETAEERKFFGESLSDDEILQKTPLLESDVSLEYEEPDTSFLKESVDKVKNFFYKPMTMQLIAKTAKNILTKPFRDIEDAMATTERVTGGEIQNEIEKLYCRAYSLGQTVREGSIRRTFNVKI